MTDTRPRTAQPNFAARRMLVSAAVITAIVVAASTVWQVFRDGDQPAASAPATWDAVAFVATASGDVTLVDRAGAPLARYAGEERVAGVYTAGSRLALAHTDHVSVLDTAAGADPQPHDVALPERARVVTRLATTRTRLLLAAGQRTGGAIRLIDAQSGAAYDVAELAGLSNPLLYTGTLRADPQGTTVAVADANTGQTVVVTGLDLAAEPTDDATGPLVENYADQPLVVGDGLLATTQIVGGRADVSVHRLGGAASAPVSMGIPAGGVLADGRLVAVTTDGAVVAVRVGDRQPRQLATLQLPPDATVTAVHPAADGTRLVVYAGSYVAVLDADGEILFERDTGDAAPSLTGAASTTTPTASTAAPSTTSPATDPPTSDPVATTPATTPAADTPIEPAEPLVPAWEWTCLAVGIGTDAAALIALDDGAELATLDDVIVTDTSADGCVVLGSDGDATVVAGAAGRSELGVARSAVLSPDGRLVVRQDRQRTTELVPLDDELQPGTPVDVTDNAPSSAYTVAFVER